MLSEPVVGCPFMLMRGVMSLNMGVSIGPFDFQSSGRNQKYKGKANLHIITTPGGLIRVMLTL